jgi:ABC-type Mn2+/Zn2+ transport system ATPase subunit
VTAALHVEDVTVRYGRVVAVDGVSFTIPAGQAVALVGRNGAGKSSLLRAVAGIEPAQGTVGVHGRPCHHEHVNAPVAYVAQRSHARWDLALTSLDVVLAGCRARGSRWWRPTSRERAAAAAALEQVGLAAVAGQPIARLSGGQAQRVLLARAFVQRPDVMLLDEPFAGLDRAAVARLAAAIHELCGAGVAVLCALHELDIARHVFGRTVALDRRVVADGPTRDVLSPRGLERLFIGESGEAQAVPVA